jgi:hypothetical protein
VVQLALSDPTQTFGGFDLSGAINRRLGSNPGSSPVFNPGNPANTPPPLQGQPLQGPGNPPFRPAPPPVIAQPIQPPSDNPLIGGTGDPELDKYLGTDTTYQSQLSDLLRQYDQYNSQKNLTASQTQADYDAKTRALNDQSTQDRLNMRNAVAARGILHSGIYANELGQYNTANQQQLTNLLGGLQNSKDNAQLAYNQFISNELAAKQSAIQEAAARRSAQLGQF